MQRRLAVLVVALSSLTACADGEGAQTDVCQAAADHIAACSGQSAPVAPACDEAQAQEVLDRSCEALDAALGDQKSDGWSAALARFGCGLGLYRYCPEVACDADADEAEGFLTAPDAVPDGASACAVDALAYQGCGACAYYACREATAGCGADGYLMRFAHHYCERYRLISEPEASPAARRFLERVRRCLVTRFDREVPEGTDCATMRDLGFASHPDCYVETGFCELSIADWLLVLNTIDDGDADFSQMLTTGVLCLREWLGG
ncbi:MAG: hypothetical protein EP329_03925 [Deltaproteobacteria bacterium]|nr:MAG: hypothetical protein EP329_03925 [Deltaproteobacteria bacterium]